MALCKCRVQEARGDKTEDMLLINDKYDREYLLKKSINLRLITDSLNESNIIEIKCICVDLNRLNVS